MSACGTFRKGNKLEVTPSKALDSLQDFMEGYTQGLESSSDAKQQEQGKKKEPNPMEKASLLY